LIRDRRHEREAKRERPHWCTAVIAPLNQVGVVPAEPESTVTKSMSG
jgi:hypothetical protein